MEVCPILERGSTQVAMIYLTQLWQNTGRAAIAP
jgi:hypothetical protein